MILALEGRAGGRWTGKHTGDCRVTRVLDRISLSPNYKWVVVGLLFFGGFLNLEDRVVIFSVMPKIRNELLSDETQQATNRFIGALQAAFLWTYALCSPFAGYFGDRLSRKLVIVTCLGLWSAVTVAGGMVTSKEQLMFIRILLAVTEAFYIPASLAIVADYHPPATRGKAVATLVIGMSLGPILGGAAAGWIGDNYGWRPVMYVLGGVGLLLAAVLTTFLRDAPVGASDQGAGLPPPRRAGLAETVAEIVRTPSVVTIMLGVGVFSFGGWMLITWLPLFLVDEFEMDLTQSGFFGNLAVTGPLLVGSLFGGVFSDYVGANQPKRRMLLLLGFYALTIPWPLTFSVASTAEMVLTSAFLFQLCRMLGELNSHPLIFDLVSPEKRSTAVGFSNCVNTFLGGVGAQIVGEYKATLGFQTVFGLVPILIAMSVGALLLAYFLTLDKDLKRRALQKHELEGIQILGEGRALQKHEVEGIQILDERETGRGPGDGRDR